MYILIALIIIGVIAFYFEQRTYSDLLALTWIACFALALIIGLSMPLIQAETHSQIAEFHSVQRTVENAREGIEIESAAFQLKIAEMNQWLASTQYWNQTIFDDWIPDEVDKLEPIQ